jgi:hypothetical protein
MNNHYFDAHCTQHLRQLHGVRWRRRSRNGSIGRLGIILLCLMYFCLMAATTTAEIVPRIDFSGKFIAGIGARGGAAASVPGNPFARPKLARKADRNNAVKQEKRRMKDIMEKIEVDRRDSNNASEIAKLGKKLNPKKLFAKAFTPAPRPLAPPHDVVNNDSEMDDFDIDDLENSVAVVPELKTSLFQTLGRLAVASAGIARSALKTSFDMVAVKHVTLEQIIGKWILEQQLELKDGVVLDVPAVLELFSADQLSLICDGYEHRSDFEFEERYLFITVILTVEYPT